MAQFAAARVWWRDANHAGPVDLLRANATPGDDQLHGNRSDDAIDGRGGDDLLSGRLGNDTLSGGRGKDLLIGAGGLDTLEGGAGDDVLRGGNARQERGGVAQDYLYGGSGDDRLIGGAGPDLLVGGSGADRFIYHSASDSAADNSDGIEDFEQLEDKLVFRGDLGAGDDLHFIGQDAFSHVAGEVRFAIFDNGKSAVQIDLDGNGVAEFAIIFTGQIHFQASDFSF